ncbi:hypothetical protein CGLO_12662 [Colletotrichum gloeosporioides Cg-14]|uniref:Uncharacterized protein n=1 Tax=Colletotrichum gloeosporioides (strain Cg-14) TaxID=1237896 RepID=T0L907_COLGC|nr:hypothetical protein CGLO_12662 [Colletotrichum gloeosporioides Cg-14]
MDSLLLHLRKQVVPIEEGPVRRTEEGDPS